MALTLTELAQSHGLDLSSLALQAGIDVNLLARVNAGRQGLPIALLGNLAAVLRVERVEVRASVPLVAFGSDRTLYNPLPPRPILGERLGSVRLSPTAPPVPP